MKTFILTSIVFLSLNFSSFACTVGAPTGDGSTYIASCNHLSRDGVVDRDWAVDSNGKIIPDDTMVVQKAKEKSSASIEGVGLENKNSTKKSVKIIKICNPNVRCTIRSHNLCYDLDSIQLRGSLTCREDCSLNGKPLEPTCMVKE